MRRNNVKAIALGGMLAAVAVVIMSLGGLIPVATYISPMLCCMTGFLVLRFCGKKIAWCWYVVVTLLSMLLGPDKEAVMVFFALGYYPLVKHRMDACKFSLPVKLLYFNLSIAVAYSVMIHLLGMEQVASENLEFGLVGLAVILLLGNVTFILLDMLLAMMAKRLR